MAEIMLEVCRRCKVPILRGRHCLACAQQEATVRQQRDAARVAQGICTRCKQPSAPYKTCAKCRQHSLQVVTQRSRTRAGANKCPRCGEPRTDLKYKCCADCRRKNREKYSKRIVSATAKRRQARKELGLCMYCGKVPTVAPRVSCRACLDVRKTKRKDT